MPFTFNGATISAREITIGEDNQSSVMAYMLVDEGQPLRNLYLNFTEFQVAAEIVGTPPIPMVKVSDGQAAVRASFAAWEKLPRRFEREWRKELAQAETLEKNGSASAS